MSVYTDLIGKLQAGRDPYGEFHAANWPTDDFGFLRDEHAVLFAGLVAERRPSVIIEVGSFLGKSARVFAGAIRVGGWDGAVVCVDTWLGENVLWGIREHRERLRFRYGRPTAYETFMANVCAARLEGYIVPVPMASVSAARLLKQHGVMADMIYIDGCHETPDVYHDLTAYWERLRPGGLMIIDDYQPDPMFTGLVLDVDRWRKENDLDIEVIGDKALVRK